METRLFIQGVNLKEDQAWKELYNYFYEHPNMSKTNEFKNNI